MHLEKEGSQNLAVFNGDNFKSAEEAHQHGALHLMPSYWTYGDYSGLADLMEMVSSISKCLGIPQTTLVIVGKSQSGWVNINEHLSSFDYL